MLISCRMFADTCHAVALYDVLSLISVTSICDSVLSQVSYSHCVCVTSCVRAGAMCACDVCGHRQKA